ncbi:MAG: Asp-tRNA(Asn)/Glu-tRNA(Gln) amidotransferase subunit GatB [Bacteroidota bacterium]
MSNAIHDKYEAVIGLEVHAQLKTNSKLFSGDANAFGTQQNTHVSPITLGHPGTLPRMNKVAIEQAIKMGLVCTSTISKSNYFARKNYFYPDLPKGYQISQHTTPICIGGKIHISTTAGDRDVLLTRIHLEEDAGKSIHDQHETLSLLDYNRAGVPLIEIVSEPDMHNAEEAAAYLTEIRKLVRWIGVCDGNMEEGSLRCDANISVRVKGTEKLGTRVEVKNLNSIKHLKHAIEIEIKRLIDIIESGGAVVQETRSYDADKGITFSIRTKEDAEDYRYFPEPDLAPFEFDESFIETIAQQLPELPAKRVAVYQSAYGLTNYDAVQLTEEKQLSDLFETIAATTPHKKTLANFLIGPVRSYLTEKDLNWNDIQITNDNWHSLLQIVADGKIGFSVAAQKLLPVMLQDMAIEPMQLAEQLDLIQDANQDEISEWVQKVLSAMPDKVEEYKKGKKGLIGLFVGEVKKISKGKADPQKTTSILNECLNK